MINSIAVNLATTTSDSGAISIISSWENEPAVGFKYFSDENDRDLEIYFVYWLEDAKRLFELPPKFSSPKVT